jgi:hypothetical protein
MRHQDSCDDDRDRKLVESDGCKVSRAVIVRRRYDAATEMTDENDFW